MIFMQVPGLPPTTNHAYYDRVEVVKGKGRGGKKFIVKRVLTTEGEKYKMETSNHLVKHYPGELRIMQPDIPLGLAILLDLPNLYNKGWPKSAKTRYKKLDVSNRVKLLEDAIAHAGGIDDCNFMTAAPSKRLGAEQTSIWIWNVDEEGLIPYALAGGGPVDPGAARL